MGKVNSINNTCLAGITVSGGAVSIDSGTSSFGLSTDASATTVNVATGGAAKVVTVGSTSGASSLALKTGTADFSLASATGTIMSALDTGEITYPLQPAFLGVLQTQDNNVTGNGSSAYTLGTNTALTEIFDQNSDFNTNGTFTAPVTGRYLLSGQFLVIGCTIGTSWDMYIHTSNRDYFVQLNRAASSSNVTINQCSLADMDAADIATVVISGSGESGATQDLFGSSTNPGCYFSGYLAC